MLVDIRKDIWLILGKILGVCLAKHIRRVPHVVCLFILLLSLSFFSIFLCLLPFLFSFLLHINFLMLSL